MSKRTWFRPWAERETAANPPSTKSSEVVEDAQPVVNKPISNSTRSSTKTTRARSKIMPTTFELVGNVTKDPELRQTGTGKAVMTLSIAHNVQRPDGSKGETSFYDVTLWDYLATNVAASVKKGDRVMVSGRIKQDRWENEDGQKRAKINFVADEVGLSLRFATGEATRVAKQPVEDVEAPSDEVEADIFA